MDFLIGLVISPNDTTTVRSTYVHLCCAIPRYKLVQSSDFLSGLYSHAFYRFMSNVSFFLPMTICNKWLHTPPSFNSSAHWSISFLRLSPLSWFPATSCRAACSKYKIKTIWVYGFSRSRGGRVLKHSTFCSPWSTQKSFRVVIQLVHVPPLIRTGFGLI
jgi:hypothetical protein